MAIDSVGSGAPHRRPTDIDPLVAADHLEAHRLHRQHPAADADAFASLSVDRADCEIVIAVRAERGDGCVFQLKPMSPRLKLDGSGKMLRTNNSVGSVAATESASVSDVESAPT